MKTRSTILPYRKARYGRIAKPDEDDHDHNVDHDHDVDHAPQERDVEKTTSPKASSTSASVSAVSSTSQLLSFFALVAIQGSHVLFFKLSQKAGKYSYNTASAIAITEAFKFFVSAAILLSFRPTERKAYTVNLNQFLCYLFLAACYCVNNQLTFWLLADLGPGQLSLGKSIVPMLTAALLWAVYDEKINSLQWACVILTVAGLINVLQADSSVNVNSSLLVVSCLITALASVVNARILQKSTTSIHVQNMLLYSMGFLMNLTAYHLQFTPSVSNLRFFEGFDNSFVWGVLVSQSLMGIAITFVYKYGGAIVKTLASAVQGALLFMIDVLLFGVTPSISALSGVVVTLTASYLYFSHALAAPSHSTKLSKKQSLFLRAITIAVFLASFISMCIVFATQHQNIAPLVPTTPQDTTDPSTPSSSPMPSFSSVYLVPSYAPDPSRPFTARVAILIGGLPRTFKKVWPTLGPVLLDSNPDILFDIFIHTSVDPKYNHSDKTVLYSDFMNTYSNHTRGVRVLSITITDGWNTDSPFPESAYFSGCQRPNHYIALRQQYADQARRLAETQLNIRYNRTLNLRPDVSFTKPVDLIRDWWQPRTLYFFLGWFERRYAFLMRDWDFGQFGEPDVMDLWHHEWMFKPCVMGIDLYGYVAKMPADFPKHCLSHKRCIPMLPPSFDGIQLWEGEFDHDPEMQMDASMLVGAYERNITLDVVSSRNSQTWLQIFERN
eukprot:c12960_g1_i1.p1 GENE.c12960_g1_i1~~c12960_g1_i1.p1  ORF type:complete len:724 (+),score=146.78 c12960_g1_i1:84-2255(+)